MSEEPEKKPVFLLSDLYDRIAERVREAGFESVDEYVTFVLEEVLKDDEEEEVSATFSQAHPFKG